MVNLDRDGASKASGKPVPATCALGAAHAGFACADLELTATTVKMASPTASAMLRAACSATLREK